MAELLFAAVGLALVFEGLLPMASPRAWREAVQRIAQMRDGQVRFLGLCSVLAGLLIYGLLGS